MGLSPNIMNENFDALSASWVSSSTGDAATQINPAGQLEIDTNNSAADNRYAGRYKDVPIPDKFTIEIKTYFNAIGTLANGDSFEITYPTATWVFLVNFCSDGLYISKTGAVKTEVGADVVLCNAGAAWQVWRFQVDKSAGEDAATVEVFLDNVSLGTVDCDYEVAGYVDSRFRLRLFGYATDDRISHIDYIRVATGLGAINDADIIQAGVL